MYKIEADMKEVTVSVYLEFGVVRSYKVKSPAKAREHASAIIKTGYRYVEDGMLTHIPPHKIDKVVAGPGINTNYPDEVSGT